MPHRKIGRTIKRAVGRHPIVRAAKGVKKVGQKVVKHFTTPKVKKAGKVLGRKLRKASARRIRRRSI